MYRYHWHLCKGTIDICVQVPLTFVCRYHQHLCTSTIDICVQVPSKLVHEYHWGFCTSTIKVCLEIASVPTVFIKVSGITSTLFHFAGVIQHFCIWPCCLTFSWTVLFSAAVHIGSKMNNRFRWANCWSVWCKVRHGWFAGSYCIEHDGRTCNTSDAERMRHICCNSLPGYF